jgi:uncharacterized membrane protein YhaH (DUF805 family)
MNTEDQQASQRLKESANEVARWLSGKIPEEALKAAAADRQSENQLSRDSHSQLVHNLSPETEKDTTNPLKNEWYYIFNGAAIGPVSEQNMRQLIDANALSLSSLVWHSDLPNWVALRSTSLINTKKASPPPSPENSLSTRRQDFLTNLGHINNGENISPDNCNKPYGGIRRTPYALIMFGLIIINIIFSALLKAQGSSENQFESRILEISLLFIAPFFPVYFRLKNIGQNPVWCLLLFIPLINVVVMVRGLIYQEGYQDSQKLDNKGKVLLWVIFSMIGFLMLLLILITIYGSFK